MPTILTTKAVEMSTYGVNVSFFDEDSLAVAPNSIYWSLTDLNGSVINSRESIGITSVQASIDIVLTSLDLQIMSGSWLEYEPRELTIISNYNSSMGTNLPLVDKVRFDVTNLSAIT